MPQPQDEVACGFFKTKEDGSYRKIVHPISNDYIISSIINVIGCILPKD